MTIAAPLPVSPPRGSLFTNERMIRLARIWCLIWPPLLAWHVAGQLRAGLTDGVDRPFGEDFINFWSAARLAVTQRWASIYDIAAFHDFQVGVVGHAIDLYPYSYPPAALLVSAPLGLLPYPLAWAAWQLLGWLGFATALRRMSPRHWLLASLAWPAVLINALGGQIGCWIAAIIGWGLLLLPKRPLIAGLLLSLLIIKPQLAWLIPLALLAGREWRALIGLVILVAPYVAPSASVRELMSQASLVGWFAFVLGLAFIVLYAVRRAKVRRQP